MPNVIQRGEQGPAGRPGETFRRQTFRSAQASLSRQNEMAALPRATPARSSAQQSRHIGRAGSPCSAGCGMLRPVRARHSGGGSGLPRSLACLYSIRRGPCAYHLCCGHLPKRACPRSRWSLHPSATDASSSEPCSACLRSSTRAFSTWCRTADPTTAPRTSSARTGRGLRDGHRSATLANLRQSTVASRRLPAR